MIAATVLIGAICIAERRVGVGLGLSGLTMLFKIGGGKVVPCCRFMRCGGKFVITGGSEFVRHLGYSSVWSDGR